MVEEHYFSSAPVAAKKISDVEFEIAGKTIALQAASGTFSANKLDAGTAVLLKEFNSFPTTGNVLDIGCGWGPIGISIASLQPETVVYGIDVNERSVEQSNSNAKRLGLENYRALLASELSPEITFSAIWSNPPIRVGKQVLHELMHTYLPRLIEGGSAYLVVQKNLGADSFQQWLSSNFSDMKVHRVTTDKGYRVIQLTKLPTHH